VGDGPARAEVETAARALGLGEHVRFLGSVGQDDLLGRYGAADVFCLPSFAEGIPVVAMEAMAMELPVVTTRIMGLPELVEDGTHGVLVPPGRVDALTDALERLIRDPEERRRMGAAGREKVRADYDVARSARRMRSVLEAELGLPA
jgi:glycosyltransferase involved in cell wall biosynthesis